MSELFDTAKYYDCRDDPEVLNNVEVSEALEDLLEDCHDPEKTALELLDDLVPIEVSAYNPVKKTKSSIAGFADSVLEDLEERFMDDFGNIEGDFDFWSGEERKELEMKLEKVFQEALDKASVWQCNVVAKKSFTAEEVLQIIPEYFDRK